MAKASPTHPRTARADENRRKAFELRKAGMSYRQIGREMNLSHVTVRDYVVTILMELAAATRDDAHVVRDQTLVRLDAALQECSRIMNNRKLPPDVRMRAVDRVVRIEAERAKLLGMYAPVEVSGPGGSPIAIDVHAYVADHVSKLTDGDLNRELLELGVGQELEAFQAGAEAQRLLNAAPPIEAPRGMEE